jgi:hypothetical protein
MLDRLLQRQVRHFDLPAGRTDLADTVAGQIKRETRVLLPPFAIHLPAPKALAACWAIMRDPAVGTAVSRATKEAVAATISMINECQTEWTCTPRRSMRSREPMWDRKSRPVVT